MSLLHRKYKINTEMAKIWDRLYYSIIISYKMAFQHIIHNNNLAKNIRQIKNTNNKK
jgi:hypothetical protein